MKPPITEPWGKLKRDGSEWHPLVDHCTDVAACMEGLLNLPVWRERLIGAGATGLDDVGCARLAVLTGWHDIGKFNSGFQAQSTPGSPRVGHVHEGIALLEEDYCTGTVPPKKCIPPYTWG